MRYFYVFKRYSIFAGAIAGALAGTPAAAIEYAVASGGSVQIDFATSLFPDCTSRGQAQVSLLQQPSGGTIEVRDGRAYPNYSTLNTLSHCNGKKVPGTLIFYRSTPGFHGTEELSYEIVHAGGMIVRRRINVSVR